MKLLFRKLKQNRIEKKTLRWAYVGMGWPSGGKRLGCPSFTLSCSTIVLQFWEENISSNLKYVVDIPTPLLFWRPLQSPQCQTSLPLVMLKADPKKGIHGKPSLYLGKMRFFPSCFIATRVSLTWRRGLFLKVCVKWMENETHMT